MKYFVELYANRNLGVLQYTQRFESYILEIYLIDGDCLVVEL